MVSTPSPTPRHSRRKEARPGELLEAALQLFLENGYAGTRVEAVAARAGVSKGTLFLYFPSKQDLFKAVVRENISGRYGQWHQEMQSFTGSSAELLVYAYEVWWHRIGNTPAGGISKLMMGEADHFPELVSFYHHEVIAPGHALIEHMLQRGMDSGEFRTLPMPEAVYLVLTPMIFVMLWRHSSTQCMPAIPGLTPESYLTSQVQNCLRGLLARPVDAADLPLPRLDVPPASPPSTGADHP